MTDIRTAARAAEQSLEGRLDDIVKLASDLTNIDSGSTCAAGVDAVSQMVADRLVPLGFVPTWTSIGDDRGRALELTRNIATEGVRLLILGHADTVWPEGTSAEWPVTQADDRMSGPGFGDMKCAVAMAVYAVTAALEPEIEAGPDAGLAGIASITVALVPDEELGSVGSRPWLEGLGQRTDVCLTLEAGLEGGGLITSRGAVGAMIATATGRTAHSTEGTGISAVSALAPLVADLESLTDRGARTICSVGILRGGTARQVVPDQCELHLDLRAPTNEDAERLVARVRTLVEAQAGDGVEIELTGGITRRALSQDGSDPLFAIATEVAAELDIEIRRIAEMGGSDASIVGEHTPVYIDGLGPIAYQQCSRAEWVDRSSILPRTALLSALIASAGTLQIPKNP